MGVIYKFKKEVVDFIVRQKKDKKTLSCRGLAEIVSKKFNIIVSKSSINSILQNSQLSSPVGRRPFHLRKARVFKIPSEKKQEFAGKVHASKLKDIPRIAKPAPQEPSKVMTPPPYDEENKSKIPADNEKETAAEAIFKIERPPLVARKFLQDRLGCIFLKAAEWDLASTPMLGEILKDYCLGFSKEELQSASEALLFLEPFGMRTLPDLAQYTGQGLWSLNGLSAPLNYHKMENMIKAMTDAPGLALRLANEIPLLTAELASLGIILEDGQKYFIDGNFTTLCLNNVQSGFSISQNKLLSNLSKDIINNIDPLILNSVSSRESWSEEFTALLLSFENAPFKKIQRVIVLDEAGQEITQFSSIPNKKRRFIAGVWPWHKEFLTLARANSAALEHTIEHPISMEKLVFDSIGKYKTFLAAKNSSPMQQRSCDERSEEFSCAISKEVIEPLVKDLSSAVRGIIVREATQPEPRVVILTNIPEGELAEEEIVASFFLRWPHLQNSYALSCARKMDSVASVASGAAVALAGESSEVADLNLLNQFKVYRLQLESYSWKHFFAGSGLVGNQAISDFYHLPGYWQQAQGYVSVELALPKEPGQIESILDFAIRRINESNVRTPNGKRLIVSRT